MHNIFTEKFSPHIIPDFKIFSFTILALTTPDPETLYQAQSTEDEGDEYQSGNYQTLDFLDVNNESSTFYDLTVHGAERLDREDEYLVEAVLVRAFDDSEEFRERFESYVDSTYELDPLFNDSKITVTVVNSTVNEFNNGTVIFFRMKTVNITVNDEDLDLDWERVSLLDEIFEFFDIDEFAAPFEELEDVEHEIHVDDEGDDVDAETTTQELYDTTTTPEDESIQETTESEARNDGEIVDVIGELPTTFIYAVK